MKKLLGFILFITISVILFIQLLPSLSNLLSYSVCDQPIHYRVDTVDPKFNLSRNEFLSDINQATKIWSNAIGKNLYVYDPKGDLSINLIYDERQSLTSQINKLENTVKSDQQSLKPEISKYQRLSSEFKQKLNDLNKEIEYWNNKGGAPPDEYEKLIAEQQDLQTEADRLNAMAQSLNVSTNEYNSQVDELNQTIYSLNNALEQRPEEGVFKFPENTIEIYFNISRTELIHTLAHELGHSLGLSHSNNSNAIMYFRTNQSTIPSEDDMAALENICRKRSIFEFIQRLFWEFAKRQSRNYG